MSSTETDAGSPLVPGPRSPERDALAPWSPDIPAQRSAPRGIRWLDAPEDPRPAAGVPPAGLDGDVPPGRPRRARIALLVAVVLVVVGVVAVGGVVALTPRTMTVQGSLVVAGRGALSTGASCSISTMPGHSVTVFGADGRVVGTAALPGEGTAVDQWHTVSPFADACRFAFTVPDVASGDASYRVGLDGDRSDTVSFSHDELTTTGAQLTYGH
ncbi:hypothetical protein [Actinomycetospora sp. TBRC 11914]|uniref:hypothetical protein n=1 Tax=Actinomycetospora sp. TBRC 11914 TaxID=2729387 RepID=UPI00145CF0F8|nr:hypothetical protein [Actinomycetospora sp. TBRC 11914]NMO90417.1 hypothetical protein [Actinomycetospora sp. TBRC 11914]